MNKTNHRNALGRGLGSLISMDDAPARGTSAISDIALDKISPNPEQPRQNFDAESISELASSIRELGIIQPLSLRKTGPDSYQIIAGERRYRAAKEAGLQTVPAYIRTANDSELTEMALIENIQREDLNPIEIALTLTKLLDQYGMTQERLSERLGKKRTTLANFIRLLRLPSQIQLGLSARKITVGHARAMLSIENPSLQLKLYGETVKNDLSVRKVEELAKKYQQFDKAGNEADNQAATSNPHEFDLLKKHLSATFGTPVKFHCNRFGKGQITFPFANEEELSRLISIFDSLK